MYDDGRNSTNRWILFMYCTALVQTDRRNKPGTSTVQYQYSMVHYQINLRWGVIFFFIVHLLPHIEKAGNEEKG